jgi:vacuolar-type H+-ATPase subunit C/Vma6
MKSELMSEADLDELMGKASANDVAQALLSSPYSIEMAEALSRNQGADAVEDAVSRNLVNTFGRLLRACGGEYRELAQFFLSRWDLNAVKSLLRNRHRELDAESGTDSLTPGPGLPIGLMKELASQNSMEALVRGLVAWKPSLSRPLEEKLADYQSTRDLRILEEALDRRYFAESGARLTGDDDDFEGVFVRNLLKLEIDRINLRILLEPRDPSSSPDEAIQRLLPRGRIPLATMREMASQTPERAVALLKGTPYAEMADDLADHVRAGNVSRLERMFELAFLQQLKRAAQQEPIGLAVLMRYAWLKYNEVMNLRMIARGADIHLSPDRIREEMVYA